MADRKFPRETECESLKEKLNAKLNAGTYQIKWCKIGTRLILELAMYTKQQFGRCEVRSGGHNRLRNPKMS